MKIVNSILDMEEFGREYSSKLTPIERLSHMRMLINTAFGLSINGHMKISAQKRKFTIIGYNPW